MKTADALADAKKRDIIMKNVNKCYVYSRRTLIVFSMLFLASPSTPQRFILCQFKQNREERFANEHFLLFLRVWHQVRDDVKIKVKWHEGVRETEKR